MISRRRSVRLVSAAQHVEDYNMLLLNIIFTVDVNELFLTVSHRSCLFFHAIFVLIRWFLLLCRSPPHVVYYCASAVVRVVTCSLCVRHIPSILRSFIIRRIVHSDDIVYNNSVFVTHGVSLLIVRHVRVTQWLIDQHVMATRSSLNIHILRYDRGNGGIW